MSSENPFEALLKINEEMNTVRETEVLLDKVMDIAMEALQAERGFILLKTTSKNKKFDSVTARNISKENISTLQELSTSIVNKVLDEGKPILTYNAQSDERFSGAQSIIMQNIKSVVCAPLCIKESTIGAIYMDSRAGKGKFNEESMNFLVAFTRQASLAIENARLLESLQAENRILKKQADITSLFPEMIGKGSRMIKIFELIRDVADSEATVLIEGESGTGKELVARALHSHSSRKKGPFIPIFCGSLAENLLESELFGHKKGAFTGAIENKAGLFEEANGGTLFLDEIADISQNIQTKLLRVIQEGEIRRVGESNIRKVNVRIVTATNKDLYKEVTAKRFREDLFYRLNVINIKLPPLRERQEDIPVLAQHFLKNFTEKNKKNITGISEEALQAMLNYHWPGNIRELENTIERAVLLARTNELTADHLYLNKPADQILVGKTLKEVERQLVLQTLESTDNNRTKAAEILGVSRRWLQYQLKEWGVTGED